MSGSISETVEKYFVSAEETQTLLNNIKAYINGFLHTVNNFHEANFWTENFVYGWVASVREEHEVYGPSFNVASRIEKDGLVFIPSEENSSHTFAEQKVYFWEIDNIHAVLEGLLYEYDKDLRKQAYEYDKQRRKALKESASKEA